MFRQRIEIPTRIASHNTHPDHDNPSSSTRAIVGPCGVGNIGRPTDVRCSIFSGSGSARAQASTTGPAHLNRTSDVHPAEVVHAAAVDMLSLGRPFVVQDDGVGAQAFVLPAGTVTFLLTDVEASSRLWEDSADEMGAAIVRHYAVLDEAIAAHGGVRPVEQGEGDSVVGAFARAADALDAAVEAQRSLTAELPWLRVRMAVHTGEAQLRDEGNYVGRAIIRCARLRGCAHGGQILLSTSAAALAADDPGDAELVDLGMVRLRDLSRPERVWQAMAAGLPSEFPPLRSLDAVPHNLPAVLTS